MTQWKQTAFDLISKYETHPQTGGPYLKAYRDPVGVTTIGYGKTRLENGSKVPNGYVISYEQAYEWFMQDLDTFNNALVKTVKVPLSDTQRAALVSLVYNIGETAWSDSTALKRLNVLDYQGAAEAMTWWNKGTVNGKKQVLNGLVRRRKEEYDLFIKDAIDNAVDASPADGVISGGEHKKPTQSKTLWTSLGGILTGLFSSIGGLSDTAQSYAIVILGLAVIILTCLHMYTFYNRRDEMRRGEH